MKGIKVLNHSCQGESHKSSGKPCQDASSAVKSSNGQYAMAIVSDGHGGTRYFRSDRGSKIAIKVTKKIIQKFLKESCIGLLFKNKKYRTINISGPSNGQSEIYEKLVWLTSSIINMWNREIVQDALDSPLSEWELSHVEQNYLDEFREKVAKKESSFEKFYGCTLMVYVQTPDFWFAFQIGDGKAVFFDIIEGHVEPSQLIPWDEKCFLNKTTSICDSDAGHEFRYAYCGDGNFPTAVFLGSDGIDDTFGDGDRLTDFYIRLYKEIATSQTGALRALERDLPELSRIGSKDDMSVACVYDSTKLNRSYLLMSHWQLDRLQEEADTETNKVSVLTEKIEQLSVSAVLSEKQRIELQYANNDLGRANAALERIARERAAIIEADLSFKNKKKIE